MHWLQGRYYSLEYVSTVTRDAHTQVPQRAGLCWCWRQRDGDQQSAERRRSQGDVAAVKRHQIARDGEAKTAAGLLCVPSLSDFKDDLMGFGRQSWAIIGNGDFDNATVTALSRDGDARTRMLAGVVRQVAEKFLQILLVARNHQGTLGRMLRMQPCGSGRGGTSQQMTSSAVFLTSAVEPGESRLATTLSARGLIIDMRLHPAALLENGCRTRGLTVLLQPVGFIRQDRERRLQSMRDVAGLRPGSLDQFVGRVEEGVQAVDERLDFSGMCTRQRLRLSSLHLDEARRRLGRAAAWRRQ